jgi:hypothetical protein
MLLPPDGFCAFPTRAANYSRRRIMRRQHLRARLELETLENRYTPAFGFQGGAVIANVQVVPLFYGDYWSTSAGMQSAAQINTFLSYVTNSSFMDTMNQYGVGRGALVGVGVIDSGLSGAGAIGDSAIQAQIANDLGISRLPGVSANVLYVVFTPPSISVTSPAGSNTPDPLGYHNAFLYGINSVVKYVVIDNPTGNSTYGSLSSFQTLTHTISMELANAVTDPTGNGWIDRSTGGEIGSMANQAGNYAYLNNYVVAGLWSAVQQTIAYPAGSTTPTFTVSANQILGANILAPVAGNFTRTLEYYSNLVDGYYEEFLDRSAGQSELNFWALDLAGGATNEQVLSMILGSDEYYHLAGSSNAAWIEHVYKDMFGRTPDGAGNAIWLNALASGATRQQVASRIDSSAEREAIVVSSYYVTYLGRTASSSEVGYWVGLVQMGATQEQVLTNILASAEYLSRAGDTLSGWLTAVYQATLNRSPDAAGFDAWIRVLNAPFAG